MPHTMAPLCPPPVAALGTAAGSITLSAVVPRPRGGSVRGRVLLLNASYEPLAVVTVRRAAVLVLGGKAELLHGHEEQLMRSATIVLAVPSVIRLSRFVLVPYHATVPLTRRAVLRRDRHECAYCGQSASTIDHVLPRSRGGRHIWDNVVACCLGCNGRKGDRLLSELGWRLRHTPYTPNGSRAMLARFGEPLPGWSPYLPMAA
ncbi:MAG: HNH endonuclease [Actinomycetota bacterium]|nr:HNH endonuclease [Actinomycetota bacterium]